MRRLLSGRSRGAQALAAAVTEPTGREGGGGGRAARGGLVGWLVRLALSARATDVCGPEAGPGGQGCGGHWRGLSWC